MTTEPFEFGPIAGLSRRAARADSPIGVRMADIAALLPDGNIVKGQRKIPTLAVFDAAFSAFSHGTQLQSSHGLVAIEDLQPGDRLLTADGGSSAISWLGSATFAPAKQADDRPLIRIMADSFGINRPDSFLSLGPGARLLQTPAWLRNGIEDKPLMTPARAFVDGVNVIEVSPPTPVRMFHLSLQRHAAIVAGGLEIETYHPGADPMPFMSQTLRAAFMSVFPHIKHLSDFGPLNYVRAPEDTDLTLD